MIVAALTLLLTFAAVRIVRARVDRALARGHLDTGTRLLLGRTVSLTLAVLGVLSALGTLGVSPAELLALTGAVGLALSLAAQDILKNFFSGVYLLLEHPFHLGDIVTVKGERGRVETIGVRTTTLRREDNVLVLVPNSVIFSEVLMNHTQQQVEPPNADELWLPGGRSSADDIPAPEHQAVARGSSADGGCLHRR